MHMYFKREVRVQFEALHTCGSHCANANQYAVYLPTCVQHGDTALTMAIKNGHLYIAELLFKTSVSKEHQDKVMRGQGVLNL